MRQIGFLLTGTLFVLLAGCGDEGKPCDGVQCGVHGTCADGVCTCDPGWQPTPDGQSCAAFPHDVCEGVSCSGLGTCVPMEGGPQGSLRPVCECDPGTVATPDDLGCIDPCADIDCAPGTCTLDDLARAVCECPPGYEVLDIPPGCRERTIVTYELILYPDEDPYPFGNAWMKRTRTDEGLTVQSTVLYRLAVSYETVVGSDIVTVGRYDDQNRLVEVAQDRLKEFGTVSLRRRLHYTVEEQDSESVSLSFDSTILDRIWHGEMELSGQTPVPMAGEHDYPGFAFGCFDPFFYQALADQVDFSQEHETSLTTMITGFAMPTSIHLLVSGSEENGVLEIPDRDTIAYFENGTLREVRISDWAAIQAMEDGAALEMNLPPLPRAPIEHDPLRPPETDEEEVTFTSADGTTLAGTRTIPTGTPETIAVLMVTDLLPGTRDKSSYHNRTYRDLAAHLAASGFASLRFDGRGSGESGGAGTDAFQRFEEDLDAAFNLLADDPRFSGVVLLAHGFATPFVLPAARRLAPAGMVVLAPTGDDFADDFSGWIITVLEVAGYLPDTIEAHRVFYRETIEALRDGTATEDFYGRSTAFWQTLLTRDPLDTSGVVAPALLLRGEEDFLLPETNLPALDSALTAGGCAVEAHVLPGLSNRFTPGGIDDLWELVHLPFCFDADAAAMIVAWLADL